MTPEFSRRERLDTIGEVPREVTIVADAAELAALARRFGLVAVERLAATFAIRRLGEGIAATGHVTGAVVQACVVTGDPLPAAIDEAVDLRFVAPGASDDEIELADDALDTIEFDGDALDTIEFDGDAIDLGEAAAETMALALDPFPRAPGAAETLAAAGVKSEEEVAPLGALAGLRDLLR